MENIVKVTDLIKRYQKAEKNAVDKISFTVKKGEFFALLGPNGAGKTTTISILITTLSKTSGAVQIAGYDLEKEASKVRQNVGIIFQNPSLDLNLTAEENIRLHAILYGLYSFSPSFKLMSRVYQRRVFELADVLGIRGEIFRPIRTFSGGMKRKLEIIRSLIHKPKILFLDEPTSGLDPQSRKNLWSYLQEVRKNEKTTIFLTTHYLEEAEEADTICIINHGKIISFGTPDEIKKSLVEEYLIIDTKDQKKLQDELKAYKIPFIKQDGFKIDLKEKTVQQVIKQINTPLSLLQIHTPSLEEAYLEIISASDKHEKGN